MDGNFHAKRRSREMKCDLALALDFWENHAWFNRERKCDELLGQYKKSMEWERPDFNYWAKLWRKHGEK